MKFIPPLEISSKIMTLIEEANKELVLVSPYVEISKWDKMKKCLERAVKRNVDIKFIVRKNARQDLTFIEQLGIKLYMIDDLHAKLYFNENYGVVTSQNVVYYSDVNSIDIAYQTENTSEKNELVDFVNKYIINLELEQCKNNSIKKNNPIEDRFQLTSIELSALSSHFTKSYNEVKFTTTSSYIFSGNLLPFADVMISSRYVIKINKSTKNCVDIIDSILKLKFSSNNKFNTNLDTEHPKFFYIVFIPIYNGNFNNLIIDYQMITREILKNKSLLCYL